MPYSQVHVQVFAEGHFGSGVSNTVEIWRAGFHLTKNGGVVGGTSELTNFLTNIRPALTTYHSTAAVGAGSSCFLDAVSGAYIGTDGNYALGSLQSTTRVPLTTSTPGSGTTDKPWPTANVISLRSLLLRGPASHGRIYWPATSQGIQGATGVIAGSTVSSVAAAAKLMLDAVNVQALANFGTGCNVGLVSKVGTGFQSPVIRVGIGQKLDHIESREGEIPEAHVFQNLTISTALLAELDDEFRRQMEDLVDTD